MRVKHLSADGKTTYSMSMHGMYVDFAKWSVVHIPGVPDVSLARFLGPDMPIEIVCYALRDGKKPHTQDNKDYLFAFQISPPGAYRRISSCVYDACIVAFLFSAPLYSHTMIQSCARVLPHARSYTNRTVVHACSSGYLRIRMQ